MTLPTYHQLSPAQGDWFVIATESLQGKPPRHTMERVVAWAVVKDVNEDGSDASLRSQRIEGITTSGCGEIHDHMDYSYVYGSDLAPNGKTWLELYNETPHFILGFKDVSEAVHDFTPEK